jgi:XTP/dITP diphosphohydrolase
MAAVPADDIGGRLMAIVTEAVAAGVDPEAALRRTARGYRDEMIRRESAAPGT